MNHRLFGSVRLPRWAFLWAALGATTAAAAAPLGLPEVPVPENNPQSDAKIALGDKLFNDTRFSTTGEVSCATCHEETKGFTDSPLTTSEGINKARGTRNAPTVANAAYNTSQFWDGRSADLEDQSQHPFVNPVEMGLPSHDPILEIVREDPQYRQMFAEAFDLAPADIEMQHVQRAIASFERTLVFGDSPWDRWYFGGDESAISESAQRGFEVFLTDGRCVSCHTIEQDRALFSDQRFHNIGVGINRIQPVVPELASAFLEAKNEGADVDVAVLSNPDTSELGRFAVDERFDGIGAFKTSTLRNIAVTAPYFHDGSAATLRDVVVHYNNGGVTNEGDPVNDFLSGGIRPLELSDDQIDDLVAFMEALTSPRFADQAGADSAVSQSAHNSAPGPTEDSAQGAAQGPTQGE